MQRPSAVVSRMSCWVAWQTPTPVSKEVAEVPPLEALLVQAARGGIVGLASLQRGQRPVQVAGDHEGIGAEAVVGDDLARHRCQQLVEVLVAHQCHGAAAGIADRVHGTSRPAQRLADGSREPGAPVEVGLAAGGEWRHRRAQPAEAS